MSIREIPVVDYSLFNTGDDEQRQYIAAQLLQAFSNYGFVKIINHGITEEKTKDLFEWNRRFFALPLDTKMKAVHPPRSHPHRGYSYVGQESISMSQGSGLSVKETEAVGDLKETFDQGSPNDKLYSNIWVPERDIPGFRKFMESFYQEFQAMHMRILSVFEQIMELPRGTFEDRCNGDSSELRITHYPACSTRILTNGVKRIAEHTDFGSITILFQDSVGGLEVEHQTRPGCFIPVINEGYNEAIINVGDCLQRWTNGKLRSANHRVTIPPSLAGQSDSSIDERFSIAFFGKPDRSQSVGPLREFVDMGTTSIYEDMTALEFNNSKIHRTY